MKFLVPAIVALWYLGATATAFAVVGVPHIG